MTPFPSIQFFTADGKLTLAAREWLAKLLAELAAKDVAIAALEATVADHEARITVLEP